MMCPAPHRVNNVAAAHPIPLKIRDYTIHKKNETNNQSDGTATATRHGIRFRIIYDFMSDLLAAESNTSTGKIIVATLYQLSARNYLPDLNVFTLFKRHIPVYMVSDLNDHPFLGYRSTNTKGRQLLHLSDSRTLKNNDPYFPTFPSSSTVTTPDIILTNNNSYLNTNITQELTINDHFPIILTIATTPIITPAPPSRDYARSNWEAFLADLTATFSNPQTIIEPNPTDLDTHLEQWYNTIKSSFDTHVPITQHKTPACVNFKVGGIR